MKSRLCLTSLAMVGVLALASGAQAAAITWGAAQDTTTSAANDVVDGGTVVVAFNGHNFGDGSEPASVTLDGITFTSPDHDVFLGQQFDTGDLLTVNTTGPVVNSTGDADYDTFLNHAAIVDTATAGLGGSNTDATYSITGLTNGVAYFVQLWYADERVAPVDFTNRVATYGDGLGSNVNVAATGANGFGQFVVGSFTADAATQDLRIAIANAGRAHATGLLVREVIPEPASMVLFGLGGLLMFRRRRAA